MVRIFQLGVVCLEQDVAGGLGPVQRVDVAQPSPAVLEVGLEEEGNLAGALVPIGNPESKVVEPALRALLPLRQCPGSKVVSEGLVAREVAHVEQRRCCVEVAARQRERLANGTHAVAQLQPGVPDRIPEPIGHVRDVTAVVVQQHDVDVAVRTQLRTRGRRPGARSPLPETDAPSMRRGGRCGPDTTPDRSARCRPAAPRGRAPRPDDMGKGLETPRGRRRRARPCARARCCRPVTPTPCRHRSCRCGQR